MTMLINDLLFDGKRRWGPSGSVGLNIISFVRELKFMLFLTVRRQDMDGTHGPW